MVRRRLKVAVAALLCSLAWAVLRAQEQPRPTGSLSSTQQGARGKQQNRRSLSSRERLRVITVALDSRKQRYPAHDCSHLVHVIYERAGFLYEYASSDDLYVGVEGFQRVTRPQPGDLVVWRGHVGIVIRPSRHTFFSYLSTGPGTDDYEAPYWKSRGLPRFYRYIKNDACPRCVPVRGTPTVIR